VLGFDDRAEPGQVLGDRQLQIQAESSGADDEHHERPCLGPAQVDQPLGNWPAHPLFEVWVRGEQGAGGAEPVP
jgi:hypothetical protein